jgi:ubiquinone/menaquinone biosynthesis C-methylase UbiE
MRSDRDRAFFTAKLRELLPGCSLTRDNYLVLSGDSAESEQAQTNAVFSSKWTRYADSGDTAALYEMQRRWYLSLYGFASERELATFLAGRRVVFDAGCGLGYKAAWFARLAPQSLVIGMDFSQAAARAALEYEDLSNLFFVQGDIARTSLPDDGVDYVSCDQTIMHTQAPDATFAELSRVTAHGGEFACYFYAKKALPRELLDDYFRQHCKHMSEQELWQMAEQLTELGRRLTELGITIEVPAIPAFGIAGGRYDLQRFLYWNFFKCFWNAELGVETSVVTNFDWYSPSKARRYSEAEVRALVEREGMSILHFHREEACYSGRFLKS